MKKFSLIIPLYNTSSYFISCIESIVKQSPRDIEVIIVNDGSTDNSGNIANFYAEKYDYIKVIHQPNQGVSAARNSALRVAQGKYLVFVDADDMLYDIFFEEVIMRIEGVPDIIEINAKFIDQEGVLSKDNIFSFIDSKKKLSNAKHSKLIFSQQAKYYLWSRIIRRSLVENLYFDDRIGFCEDALYLTECYFKAKKIVTLNQSLYGYRQHATNVTRVNASHNINQLSDLAKIIKNKIVASSDRDYSRHYFALFINIIHLRKSMYAIDSQRIICDKTSLDNIDSIKTINQRIYLNKERNISWLRWFSIFAPKTSNFFILLKFNIRINRLLTINK